MADWFPEDHLVWFIFDVVERWIPPRCMRSPYWWSRSAGYDPDMLLALLIYAYAMGQRSSRRIEELCVDHVAYRVLCAQDGRRTIPRSPGSGPSPTTRSLMCSPRCCGCAPRGWCGGVISIDGTKIAANASRSANRARTAVPDQAPRIAPDVIADAAAVDAAEDEAAAAGGQDRDALPPGLATGKGRAVNMRKALAELDRQEAERAQPRFGRTGSGPGVLHRAGTEPAAWPGPGRGGSGGLPPGPDPPVSAADRRAGRRARGPRATSIRGDARRMLKQNPDPARRGRSSRRGRAGRPTRAQAAAAGPPHRPSP